MGTLFPEAAPADGGDVLSAPAPRLAPGVRPLLAALVALLLAGTLKLAPLEAVLLTGSWPSPALSAFGRGLSRLFPFDPARGEEGLTVHGLSLIGMLLVWGVVSWRGLTHVEEGMTRATVAALALTAVMLAFAALGVVVDAGGVRVTLSGRTVAVAVVVGLVVALARRLDRTDVEQWLWETWRFVRQIVPLLLAGVFVVGLVRVWIRPEWVQAVAGANTFAANAAGVAFGVFMYFPTLVEVPVAKLFLSLGMHPGPLLAYLMADPELSLQSILVISTILGVRRTVGWVGLVAVFSLGAGLLWGARADGVSIGWLLAGTVAWGGAAAGAVKVVARLLHHRPQVTRPA